MISNSQVLFVALLHSPSADLFESCMFNSELAVVQYITTNYYKLSQINKNRCLNKKMYVTFNYNRMNGCLSISHKIHCKVLLSRSQFNRNQLFFLRAEYSIAGDNRI